MLNPDDLGRVYRIRTEAPMTVGLCAGAVDIETDRTVSSDRAGATVAG
jgi:hypothetical protein